MSRKAIVHIGPMKTGSSSIQYWLDRKDADLRAVGVLVPAGLGSRNMSRLAYMAQAIAKSGEMLEADLPRLEGLRAEMEALPDEIKTVVFSGEMLGQLLFERAEVAAVKTMLDEFFDEYHIIVYLRRQDELSLSRYSTALRRGQRRASLLMNPLDYGLLLDLWSEIFGRDSVTARMFDRHVMPGGDVVRDFATTAGLPFIEIADAPLDRNASLLPEAQTFLSNLARRVRESGYKPEFTQIGGLEQINRRLNLDFKGKGLRPARAEAIEFYDQVKESNERVRKDWFPERETLFSEDFSTYPDEASPAPPDDRLLEVAMTVLVDLVTGGKIRPGTEPAVNRATKPARLSREERLAKKQRREGKRRGAAAAGEVSAPRDRVAGGRAGKAGRKGRKGGEQRRAKASDT